MEKKKAAAPLVLHGPSRPVVDLFYSPVTPDGYFLISASKDSNPMLRNGETGDWIGTFEGHKGAVWSCCLDTNALRAASGSADFSAKVWDALTGDELHSFEHKHIVRACAFSKGTHLLLTGGMDTILRVYDLNRPDAAPKELAKSPDSIRTVAWLHNDQTILSSCTDTGGVRLWDVRSEKIVQTLETKAPVTSAEVSQDGRFITTADGSGVKFWDANNFGLVKSYDMSFTVESASLEPKSGSKFIAGGEDMSVHVFDFVTGEEIACNKGHHGPVHCVRFAPGGESYGSGSEDGTIRIWQLITANTDTEEAPDAHHKPKAADRVLQYTSLMDELPNLRDDNDCAPMHAMDPENSLYWQTAAEFDLNSTLLEDLVNPVVREILAVERLNEVIVRAMRTVSAFIHMLLDTFGDHYISVLANQTDFILAAMKFLKLCQMNNLSMRSSPTACGVPEWILTLPLFSLVFKYILQTIDHDELYEQHVPFSYDDLQFVVVIMKEALWDLIFCTPMGMGAEAASAGLLGFKKLKLEKIKSKSKQPICDLLLELQDWNTRKAFTSATNFCCEKVGEDFISKAVIPGTLESDVIKFAPFLIPFKTRAEILEEQISSSKSDASTELLIRRNHLVEDSFRLINLSDNELKGKIRIIFEDERGMREDGIDLGGPYREFIEDTIKESFSPETNMMMENLNNHLYPNPNSGLSNQNHLNQFRFLGTILGKAMFDGATIDLPLAEFFVRKIMQKPVCLIDLKSLDMDIYGFLNDLKPGGTDPLSNLSMYFEENIIADGNEILMDDSNVHAYVHLYANHRLNTQIEPQSIHFLMGFHRLLKKEWIDMFNEHEFQMLISGHHFEKGLDIADMCKNTEYEGYEADDKVITAFWEVLSGLKVADQMLFLKFVTGQSHVHFGGFKKLQPKFNIDRDPGGVDRWPTSSTCLNCLHLPPYESAEKLRSKLLKAIKSGASFGLA